MPAKLKATNSQLLESYAKTKSVWNTADEFGMCGQSAHERLTKIGAVVPVNFFTDEDNRRLSAEYIIYRDAGKLDVLASTMGRTKPFICRQARYLGLTDKNCKRPYGSVWKYLAEDAARVAMDAFLGSSLGVRRYCRTKNYDDLGFSRCMQKFFPDEWDIAVESKVPKQSLYRIGRALEYRCRDALKKLGYFVLRSPASKSPLDLVAVRSGLVLFVQCKRGGSLPPLKWNALFDLAATVQAIPVLASQPVYRGIDWYKLIGKKDGSKRPQPMVPFIPPGPEWDARIDRHVG